MIEFYLEHETWVLLALMFVYTIGMIVLAIKADEQWKKRMLEKYGSWDKVPEQEKDIPYGPM